MLLILGHLRYSGHVNHLFCFHVIYQYNARIILKRVDLLNQGESDSSCEEQVQRNND